MTPNGEFFLIFTQLTRYGGLCLCRYTDMVNVLETVGDDPNMLDNLVFSPADMEKACSELRANAAPGPDGVPAMLLKSCKKVLSQPLYTLWRKSLDSGTIPPELLLVLVTPVHKGGSRAVPKNYRPVALTSHLIKVFERVLRQGLVTHMEAMNIIPDDQHGSR